jgi:murein DD-endopeptidase MepM/ murein hydrolase activator NlpD
MELFNLQGEWLHAAVGILATLIALGLLAAGFALSAGGSPEQARAVVEEAIEKKKEKERPATVWAGPLRLPTENVALFEENGGPQFFQHTSRDFEEEPMRPWESGQYGFVRTPVRTEEQGIVYTRFHEGIDIQATRRDEHGEPMDTVRATDRGLVAYTNETADASNYGKYVVVEHQWEGAPYYSLYAHLSEVFVDTGERVRQGRRLGRVGYTGAGINEPRAHVHFELNVLINDHFRRWIEKHFGGNPHGVYSGLNMRGFNAADYFEALRDDPDLKLTQFLQQQEPYYKVAFPRTGPLDLLRRYPWMRPEGVSDTTSFPSWEMSFTRGGFPLGVNPYDQQLSEPKVTMNPPLEGVSCMHTTYEHLGGVPPNCTLAPRGRRYIDLITMQGAGEGGSRRAW